GTLGNLSLNGTLARSATFACRCNRWTSPQATFQLPYIIFSLAAALNNALNWAWGLFRNSGLRFSLVAYPGPVSSSYHCRQRVACVEVWPPRRSQFSK